METSDLNLSNHNDVSILHKIIKIASQQKLNFSSIQLALKTLVKSKEISQLDKYLNFFMLIKSNMKDDSSITWNQLFHIYIRKLQRQILGDVCYHKGLIKKCFVKWREQLNMKIIENYVVTVEDKKKEELVDHDIKIKARVFHCWMLYINKKIEKRDKKQQEENQIQKIGRQFEINKISKYLKRWKEHLDEIKSIGQSKQQIVEYLQNNRKIRALVLLKQNKQRRQIVDALQQKIRYCIITVQKHSLFSRLRTNIRQIVKPKKINSYYGMIFLKHLIERVYNDRKSLEYSNLHSVIKFKSKARRQIFNDQMEVFYSILKQKSFKSWKIAIKQRQLKVNKVLEFVKRSIVKSLKDNSRQSLVVKNKMRILKRIVLKKSIKNLMNKVEAIQRSRTHFQELESIAEQRITFLRKQISFPLLKKQIRQSQQWNSQNTQLHSLLFSSRIKCSFKQFYKTINVAKVSHNIPLLNQNKLLKKYFKDWLKFYQQRDTNMVGIYRFQINYTKKVKSFYFDKLKQSMQLKNKESTNIKLIQNTIKSNVFNQLLNNNKDLISTKPLANKLELLQKQIYFTRFKSGTISQLQKKCQQENQYNKVFQIQTKSKVFNVLRKNIQQRQQNINNTMQFIQQFQKKRALSFLFEQTLFTNKTTKLNNNRFDKSTSEFFNIMNTLYNESYVGDQRQKILEKELIRQKLKLALNRFRNKTVQSEKLKSKFFECSHIRKMNSLKLMHKISSEQNSQKSEIFKKQTQLSQALSKRIMRKFNTKSQQFIQNLKRQETLSDISQKLQLSLNKSKLFASFDLLKMHIKYKELKQRIQNKKIQKWRLFIKQLKKEIRISKQNDIWMQKFIIKRNKKILKTTLRSFIVQLNKRQKSLDIISSIAKSKQINILRYSMNSIFDEYRVCFKLNACQQIRKRFALQSIINNHLNKQTIKLQEYKSVKHYAETLANKVFRGFTLSIYKSTFHDQNTSSILKTIPNVDYHNKRYTRLY